MLVKSFIYAIVPFALLSSGALARSLDLKGRQAGAVAVAGLIGYRECQDVPGVPGGDSLHCETGGAEDVLEKAGNNIGGTCSCDNGQYCCGAGVEALRDSNKPQPPIEIFRNGNCRCE